LVVGADRGVFATLADAPGTWQEVGANLPNAPVFDMHFIPREDRLVAGLLGGGAWTVVGLAGGIINQPPVAVCRDVVLDAGSSCTASISAASINDGSNDPDGGPVNCVASSTGPFGVGSTPVTLTCTDAQGARDSCTANVHVGVGNNPNCCPAGTLRIVGTSGSNNLVGTDGSDCILGLDGSDIIDARGGNDFVSGGSGSDTIVGGFGNDLITGGSGNDTIDSGPGNDRVGGGIGDDTIAGGPGDDVVDGGDGADTCSAAPGNDAVLMCEF
jgi:Ca2+-binding RTX toxin-like protein